MTDRRSQLSPLPLRVAAFVVLTFIAVIAIRLIDRRAMALMDAYDSNAAHATSAEASLPDNDPADPTDPPTPVVAPASESSSP